jgi:hypothetical protein
MKKHLFKPGFEFIYSGLIIVALALPQFLFAQKGKSIKKEVRITIRDNDTTFNGKNLRDLQAKEKQDALTEIAKMGKDAPSGKVLLNFQVQRMGGKDTILGIDSLRTFTRIAPRVRTLRRRTPEDASLQRSFDLRIDGRPINRGGIEQFDLQGDDAGIFRNGRPGMPSVDFYRRRNTQSFNYNHTDKDGITTNVSYRVADAPEPALKDIAGVMKADLELTDLTITPQFSAGKTTVSFTLPAKGIADVRLTDTEGKTLWNDKTTTGSFNKAFAWSLNGVYYLVVKQSGKTAVKKIVKED